MSAAESTLYRRGDVVRLRSWLSDTPDLMIIDIIGPYNAIPLSAVVRSLSFDGECIYPVRSLRVSPLHYVEAAP